MIDDRDVAAWSISRLTDGYVGGEVSAAEVLRLVRSRLDTTEPVVHAYEHLTWAWAEDRARHADDVVGGGELIGPLHGVPVAIKDLIAVGGHPTRAGSTFMEDVVPDAHAEVVDRILAAGALVIGKSVTHEFGLGANLVETRNAWDPTCYSGGSSAGSGVSVAVGTAWAALGSDTGGSIRVPAALNGVVGLKPTYGRVGRRGVVPLAPSLDVVGPLARRVEDCARLLAVVAGPAPSDRTALDEPVDDYTAGIDRPIDGMRLGLDRTSFFGARLDEDVRTTVDAAIDELVGLGAEVIPVEVPMVDSFLATGLVTMVAEAAEYHHERMRRHGHRYSPDVRITLMLGDLVPASAYVKAQQVRAKLRDGVRHVYERNGLDALVAPTIPVTTMPLDEWYSDDNPRGEPAMRSCMRHGLLANLTGLPSLAVPVGFDHRGRPASMQLVGRPFGESTLLRLGHAYQEVTSWHEERPSWIVARSGVRSDPKTGP